MDKAKLVQDINNRLFCSITPCYFLDEGYYFVDWNKAFEEIFAKPLNLKLGMHAMDFVYKWQNAKESEARVTKVFSVDKTPATDHEPANIMTKKYGLIKTQKLATRIECDDGEAGWVVFYNILSADHLDKLFDDLMKICEKGVAG